MAPPVKLPFTQNIAAQLASGLSDWVSRAEVQQIIRTFTSPTAIANG
jgi:hypothetical protein